MFLLNSLNRNKKLTDRGYAGDPEEMTALC